LDELQQNNEVMMDNQQEIFNINWSKPNNKGFDEVLLNYDPQLMREMEYNFGLNET